MSPTRCMTKRLSSFGESPGSRFEQVLLGQQFLYRGVAILGLFLIALAAGLPARLAWVVAALLSLGAAIIGPAVLLVEYEPVPRGFSLPFVIFSMGALAHGRWTLSAVSASIALRVSSTDSISVLLCLALILIYRRHWRASTLLAIGPLLLAVSASMHPASVAHASLFGKLSPDLEALQRMRASYNWVGLWAAKWMPLYAVLCVLSAVAWWRVRRELPRDITILALALSAAGIISVPMSYVLLERGKLAFAAQFQPARYLLFVTLFAMLLTAIAASHAALRKRRLEAAFFFVVPLALTAMEWDTAKLTPARMAVVCALALYLAAVSVSTRYVLLAPLAAAIPFVVLPYAAGVASYPLLHTAELDSLAQWARDETPKDAVFQFADSGRGLEPGVFRARARRALYVDWKAGGQVNFLPDFRDGMGPSDGAI